MRSVGLLLLDLLLILLATFAAITLRDNFETSATRLADLMPYIVSSVLVSALVLPFFGIHRTIWRFSAMPDYLRLAAAVAAIVVCSVLATFAVNRLELVPRSLPFLQFNVAITFLIGFRVLYRMHHAWHRRRRKTMTPLQVVDEVAEETVLLVGLSRLTEIYLQSVAELAPRRLKVVGILGRHDRHVGRLVAAHKVLGLPEHLDRVIPELEVAGITVKRIVVTAQLSSLSHIALDIIESIRRTGAIKVQYLAEELGFEPAPRQTFTGPGSLGDGASATSVKFEIQSDEIEIMRRRSYWKAKRAIDVTAALALLLVTLPLQLLVAACVAASVGWPLVFWQQRPGLGGRPFRLHKFRTMGAALAADGRRLSDAERVSRVGNFLRRTRLDELPQLFSILRGHMSFIGPRPLLPRDQDDAHRARLLVRPGLTGWAQVIGGRTITAQDKAALDVWYVKNASLKLDLEIVLRTIPMVFFGERVSERLIRRAWQDLASSGVLRAKEGLPTANRGRAPAAA